ncbi:MAG: sigma-70 family RNA polymerase sigma factor [Planctomycetota bacterium]
MQHPPADSDPPTADTRALQAGARAGGAELGALYERLAPALYSWACLRMPPELRARLEPADLLQDVWVRALRAIEHYDPERCSFRAWMFQVAKYALLDAHRRLRARPEGGPAAGERRDLDHVPEEVTSISRRLAREEALALFVERARGLPDADRALLVHCGLEAMAVREAARQLGLSVAAAEKRWQRLRRALAAQGWAKGLLAAEG